MKKKSLLEHAGVRSVLASLLSILIGMLAGGIIILIVGLANSDLGIKGVWEGVRLVIGGLFSTGRSAAGALTFGFNSANFGNMLFRAVPLIMTGLSVALSQKAGLFNIGAPGQYLVGGCGALYVALSLPVEGSALTQFMLSNGAVFSFYFPAWLVWTLAFLCGMACGALWGAIPGMLKAKLNINEVLACIMTNWIAANLVTWIFDESNLKNMMTGNKNGYIYATAQNDVATGKLGLDKLFSGSQVNGGILLAIVIAVLVYVLLTRTTKGYEIKACGANRYAARYAGIHDQNTIVLTMAIAGALAAAGGALYYLSGNTEMFWSTYQSLPAEGFNGIPVALLASNNPLGVIFTAMFLSMLDICGQQLKNLTAYNEYITDVIIAVIVYLSAFSLVIKLWLQKLAAKKKEQPAAAGKGAAK